MNELQASSKVLMRGAVESGRAQNEAKAIKYKERACAAESALENLQQVAEQKLSGLERDVQKVLVQQHAQNQRGVGSSHTSLKSTPRIHAETTLPSGYATLRGELQRAEDAILSLLTPAQAASTLALIQASGCSADLETGTVSDLIRHDARRLAARHRRAAAHQVGRGTPTKAHAARRVRAFFITRPLRWAWRSLQPFLRVRCKLLLAELLTSLEAIESDLGDLEEVLGVVEAHRELEVAYAQAKADPAFQAEVAEMRKQYAQATEWYTRAIEADPSVASIYTNRAAALYAAGKYSEAADDAKTSVGIDEKWVKGWYRLGLCLEKLERLPAAVEAFELGLKVNLESYAACSREACVNVAPRPSTAELTRAARRSRLETLPQADPTNAQLREGLERTSAAAEALPKTAADAKAMGNAAYKVGQYEEASKWYTYAMDLLKSGDAADAAIKATLLTNRAEAYRQQAVKPQRVKGSERKKK